MPAVNIVMWLFILQTFLFSLSPFGEGRVGIPMGMINGLHPLLALGIGLAGNLLVYPVFNGLLNAFDKRLWRYKQYKKQSIRLMRRAKNGVGKKIEKYGFWGLMLFVMIPLPFTGAYLGVVAARVLNIKPASAYKAISLGILISSSIIALLTHLSLQGVKLL